MGSSMALRVAIADDSYLVREGLRHLLAGIPDLEVVAVCEDARSLLEAVERDAPDVVVSDIRMPSSPELDGIRVAAGLRETHPEIGGRICSRRESGTATSWSRRFRRWQMADP
jgi:DNA-binding NarL/FixJ family response regulator